MAIKSTKGSIKLLEYFLLLFIFLFPFGQLTQIPFIDIRIYAQDIVLLLLWACILINHERVKSIIKTKVFLPTVIFIAVATISLFFACVTLPIKDVFISSLYLLRFVGYAGIGIAVWRIVSEKQKQKGIIETGLILAGTLTSIFGLFQYVFYPDLRNLYYLGWDPHFLRVFGTFFDPNFIGLIITLTILLIAFSSSVKDIKIKGVLLLINGIALALTYSRSSYLAFLVAFIAVCIMQKKKKLAALILCLSVVVLILLPRGKQSEGIQLERIASIGSRIESVNRGITIFSKSPIFGVGFNTLKYYQPYKIQYFDGKEVPNNSSSGIENSFVFLLATTGILGFGAYMVVLKNMYIGGDAVLKASLIAVTIHSLLNNSLFYPWIMAWIWIMVGISLSSKQQSHSQQHQ